jgi:nitrate reductase beta subunit
MKRQMAVRYFKRAQDVGGGVDMQEAHAVLREARLSVEEAEEIYHLTSD